MLEHFTAPSRRKMLISAASVVVVGVGAATALALADGTKLATETVGVGSHSKTVTRVVTTVTGIVTSESAGTTEETTTGSGPTIPAGMISSGTPVPVSPVVIKVTNGWELANGTDLVAVYAGTAGNNSANGRFVIVRQHAPTGSETMSVVDVPASGAVKIVNAPTADASQSDASASTMLTTDLPYTAANGTSGTLDLSNDTETSG